LSLQAHGFGLKVFKGRGEKWVGWIEGSYLFQKRILKLHLQSDFTLLSNLH
jgi:hypothetical protein